jgi:hypothetical protein
MCGMAGTENLPWIHLEIYRYKNLLGWYLAEIIKYDISTLIDIDELIFHVKELIDPWDQYFLMMVILS